MTQPGPAVDVSCVPADRGWRCLVTVGDDPAGTRHQVDVSRATLERMDPGAIDPEPLVRRSFEFLLAREPRESILRSFELTAIGRYFPEWEREVARTGGQ